MTAKTIDLTTSSCHNILQDKSIPILFSFSISDSLTTLAGTQTLSERTVQISATSIIDLKCKGIFFIFLIFCISCFITSISSFNSAAAK